MDVEPTVCLSTADVDVVCVAPKKKARASPGLYLYRRGDGCFLSLMQCDETTIGYFNRMKLKNTKIIIKKDAGNEGHWGNRRAHERASIGETAVAIFHHGYSRRVAGVIRFCHRYSFYSFNAEKFNSFYSKINEWPQCVKCGSSKVSIISDQYSHGSISTTTRANPNSLPHPGRASSIVVVPCFLQDKKEMNCMFLSGSLWL